MKPKDSVTPCPIPMIRSCSRNRSRALLRPKDDSVNTLYVVLRLTAFQRQPMVIISASEMRFPRLVHTDLESQTATRGWASTIVIETRSPFRAPAPAECPVHITVSSSSVEVKHFSYNVLRNVPDGISD
jgi:hypothetical protein